VRFAIAAWIAGGSLAFFLEDIPSSYFFWLSVVSVILTVSCLYWIRSAGVFKVALSITIPIIFALLGFWWSVEFIQARLQTTLPTEYELVDLEIVGIIDQLPQGDKVGQRFSFDVEQWLIDSIQPLRPFPKRVYLSWNPSWRSAYKKSSALESISLPDLIPGQRWRFKVRLKRPRALLNPHSFDFERWMFHHDFAAHGSVRSGLLLNEIPSHFSFPRLIEKQRWTIREKISRLLPTDAKYRGVLVALVIGDQNAIPQEDWRIFNATGVGHLISISGLHVTMLAGLGSALGIFLWRKQYLPLVFPTYRIGAALAFITAFLYAWLAGFQIPAQRTMYMLGVACLALWANRISRPFDIWWWALFLVIVVDPMAAYTPGFWLSFGAVAAILYGMGESSSLIGIPTGKEYERSLRIRVYQAICEATRLQILVTIALLPFTLYWFYQFSLASIIANALAIPLISFVVTPFAIAGAFLPDWVATFFLNSAHAAMELLGLFLNWTASWSWSVVWSHQPHFFALLISLVGVIWFIAPGPLRVGWYWRCLGLVLICILFIRTDSSLKYGEFKATVFDIGQGSAVLVETRQHRMLYDTGPSQGKDNAGERILLPFFRGEGIRKIDRLVISHKDTDHTGGFKSLLNGIAIDSFLGSIPEDHELMNDLIFSSTPSLPCRYGQSWNWDGVEFKVWHPSEAMSFSPDLHQGKPNELSCVIEVRNQSTSFWLTGDIEKNGERELSERLEEQSFLRKLNHRPVVFMAPHHGSKTSSSRSIMESLQPSYAFSQNGYLNRYGHPHPSILSRYQEYGLDLMQTPHTGAQIWHSGKNQLNFYFYRQRYKRVWHRD
jgi:competence protein ComEC